MCNFSIVNQDFWPQDRIEKLHRIGSLLAKSGWPLQFLWKYCFRNHNYNMKMRVQIVKGLRVEISALAKFDCNPNTKWDTLCPELATYHIESHL